jgi:hypothetical protein
MDHTKPPPAFDMAALFAEMARMQAERAEEVRQIRADLLVSLREAGIDCVEAHYDAYGDSGNIEEVTLLPEPPEPELPEPELPEPELPEPELSAAAEVGAPEGELSLGEPHPRLPDAIMTRLQDMLWSTVYALHPGFENNEGGYGDITWDLATDQIAIEHSERFVDVTSYSHEGV